MCHHLARASGNTVWIAVDAFGANIKGVELSQSKTFGIFSSMYMHCIHNSSLSLHASLKHFVFLLNILFASRAPVNTLKTSSSR